MSEKSPSIADIWNKHYATQEAFTKAMYKFRNQTLADVKKIIRKKIDLLNERINTRTLNSSPYISSSCQLTVVRQLEEEIKKIQSQPFDGQSRSMGEPLKRETSPAGGHKARLVSPLAPSTNTQNLKGCGNISYNMSMRRLNNKEYYCKEGYLCQKCQGKVKT